MCTKVLWPQEAKSQRASYLYLECICKITETILKPTICPHSSETMVGKWDNFRALDKFAFYRGGSHLKVGLVNNDTISYNSFCGKLETGFGSHFLIGSKCLAIDWKTLVMVRGKNKYWVPRKYWSQAPFQFLLLSVGSNFSPVYPLDKTDLLWEI